MSRSAGQREKSATAGGSSASTRRFVSEKSSSTLAPRPRHSPYPTVGMRASSADNRRDAVPKTGPTDAPPNPTGQADTDTGRAMALRAVDVFKSYPLGAQRVDVLKGVRLEVPPGEIVAVMGPSGVGKSTLLNCVAGLDIPDEGKLWVLDRDVAGMSDLDRTLLRRRHVGIIYQFFNLVSNLTAYENVTLPYLIDSCPIDRAAAEGALERVGLSHRAGHLPAQLSGGEMQLVSIARAIVRGPALVLADEPTGNVNVATGRRIMAMLRETIKETGSAMVLVTHNPDDAAAADRVVFMKDGVLPDEATLCANEVSVAAVHARLQSLGI